MRLVSRGRIALKAGRRLYNPPFAYSRLNGLQGDSMPVYQHTRSKGQQLTYSIDYNDDEYFIERDGKMLKSVPDAVVTGVTPQEAKAALMLRMAIADIENLIGMDE
jgi:hypothetical protein